jgi:hypothetical protein
MFLHDPILDASQKRIAVDAMLLYIQELQCSFYRDKSISQLEYNEQMDSIADIIQRLKLSHHDNPHTSIRKHTA